MNKYDVVIIGAGVAGLTAAHWCSEMGCGAAVFESGNLTGGQVHWIHNAIENYPGRKAENGAEFLDFFLNTIDFNRFSLFLNNKVMKIEPDRKTLLSESGEEYHYRSLIIASGVRRRRLNIEGEMEFSGKGILTSGAGEAEKTKGKTVAVIGGGDAALENSLILAEYARKVYLIHRRERFSARREFVEKVRKLPKIQILAPARPIRICGNARVERIICENQDRDEIALDVDYILIRIGVLPNTEFLNGCVSLDKKGYILVDGHCRTNINSIFAIGDCAATNSPTLPTAVGMGATAAKNIQNLLKAENRI